MLGEHGREHDVRRDRAVAAEDAVDIGAFQAGIGISQAPQPYS
jgi:hypothetical protein